MPVNKDQLVNMLLKLQQNADEKLSSIDRDTPLEGADLTRAAISMGAKIQAEWLIDAVRSGLFDEGGTSERG